LPRLRQGNPTQSLMSPELARPVPKPILRVVTCVKCVMQCTSVLYFRLYFMGYYNDGESETLRGRRLR